MRSSSSAADLWRQPRKTGRASFWRWGPTRFSPRCCSNVAPQSPKRSARPKPSTGTRAVSGQPNAPWPVRQGGWVLRIYENSLSLVFVLLFAGAFFLHAAGGTRAYNEDQLVHGQPIVSLWDFLQSADFWFHVAAENWQKRVSGAGFDDRPHDFSAPAWLAGVEACGCASFRNGLGVRGAGRKPSRFVA